MGLGRKVFQVAPPVVEGVMVLMMDVLTLFRLGDLSVHTDDVLPAVPAKGPDRIVKVTGLTQFPVVPVDVGKVGHIDYRIAGRL